MKTANWQEIEEAKKAALEVLLHNAHGPYHGLPRTAGWGYPEPYTRDLMFSILGIAVSENQKLLESIRRVLETLAKIRQNMVMSLRWCTTKRTVDQVIQLLCFCWVLAFSEK
jgi:hypothetical protein